MLTERFKLPCHVMTMPMPNLLLPANLWVKLHFITKISGPPKAGALLCETPACFPQQCINLLTAETAPCRHALT